MKKLLSRTLASVIAVTFVTGCSVSAEERTPKEVLMSALSASDLDIADVTGAHVNLSAAVDVVKLLENTPSDTGVEDAETSSEDGLLPQEEDPMASTIAQVKEMLKTDTLKAKLSVQAHKVDDVTKGDLKLVFQDIDLATLSMLMKSDGETETMQMKCPELLDGVIQVKEPVDTEAESEMQKQLEKATEVTTLKDILLDDENIGAWGDTSSHEKNVVIQDTCGLHDNTASVKYKKADIVTVTVSQADDLETLSGLYNEAFDDSVTFTNAVIKFTIANDKIVSIVMDIITSEEENHAVINLAYDENNVICNMSADDGGFACLYFDGALEEGKAKGYLKLVSNEPELLETTEEFNAESPQIVYDIAEKSLKVKFSKAEDMPYNMIFTVKTNGSEEVSLALDVVDDSNNSFMTVEGAVKVLTDKPDMAFATDYTEYSAEDMESGAAFSNTAMTEVFIPKIEQAIDTILTEEYAEMLKESLTYSVAPSNATMNLE